MQDQTDSIALFQDAATAAATVGKGAAGVVSVAGAALDAWDNPSVENIKNVLKMLNDHAKPVAEAGSVIARFMAGEATNVQIPDVPPKVSLIAEIPANIGGMTFGGMIPDLNLATGLINVGIGVYSAVQIAKLHGKVDVLGAKIDGVDGKVDELHYKLDVLQDKVAAGFERVEKWLGWQAVQIAILREEQASTTERLEAMHQAMTKGFDGLRGVLKQESERRVHDEYKYRVSLLELPYKRLCKSIAEGLTPGPGNLQGVIDSSDRLEATCSTQLGHSAVGAPERLPYFVAKAFAIRARADALQLQGERPGREVADLISEISNEAFALCNGRSLHSIGVEVSDLLAQYVFLSRGLAMGTLLAGGSNGLSFRVQEATWDDGLGAIRSLARLPSSVEAGWLPLSTFRDLDWYVAWKGESRANVPLPDVRAVDLLDVARQLGFKGRPATLKRAQVEGLLAVALPAYRDQALMRLVAAFGWKKSPSISVPPPIVAAPRKPESPPVSPKTADTRFEEVHRSLGALGGQSGSELSPAVIKALGQNSPNIQKWLGADFGPIQYCFAWSGAGGAQPNSVMILSKTSCLLWSSLENEPFFRFGIDADTGRTSSSRFQFSTGRGIRLSSGHRSFRIGATANQSALDIASRIRDAFVALGIPVENASA